MFICLDCFRIFENPKHYIEKYDLDAPPYEEWDGCPICGGVYTDELECDGCGKTIVGDYIKLNNGERYCENCYRCYELGDED